MSKRESDVVDVLCFVRARLDGDRHDWWHIYGHFADALRRIHSESTSVSMTFHDRLFSDVEFARAALDHAIAYAIREGM